MNTTGVRPLAFACSTCCDSRCVNVAILAPSPGGGLYVPAGTFDHSALCCRFASW